MSQDPDMTFWGNAAAGNAPVSDAELDAFRGVGDPLADGAITEMDRPHAGQHPLESLRRTARTTDGAARELLWQVERIPPWVDFDRMLPGTSFAFRNVVGGGVALLCGSLTESFAAADGARVLVRSGQLQRNTARRLFETADFVTELAASRGPRPGSQAFRDVVAVRLVHARVRQATLAPGDWDDAWGYPVNQEDNAGTLCMFSLVYRRALKAIGIELTEEIADSVHHSWMYTGYLLGVDPALLTATRHDEAALYAAISRRQYRRSEDSQALASALLDAMSGRRPFFIPQGAIYELSRIMVGPELANLLGFDDYPMWRRLLSSVPVSNWLRSRVHARSAGVARGTGVFGRGLARSILAVELGKKPSLFR